MDKCFTIELMSGFLTVFDFDPKTGEEGKSKNLYTERMVPVIIFVARAILQSDDLLAFMLPLMGFYSLTKTFEYNTFLEF